VIVHHPLPGHPYCRERSSADLRVRTLTNVDNRSGQRPSWIRIGSRTASNRHDHEHPSNVATPAYGATGSRRDDTATRPARRNGPPETPCVCRPARVGARDDSIAQHDDQHRGPITARRRRGELGTRAGPLNDLMFGIDPPGHLPRRRQAKFVRRMLLCVPARVIHHARRIILRLPAGLVSAPAFQAAYTAARGLAPPPRAA
jgi:hypothetical protein